MEADILFALIADSALMLRALAQLCARHALLGSIRALLGKINVYCVPRDGILASQETLFAMPAPLVAMRW